MSDALCSVQSSEAAEPVVGTAPNAGAWICLEQPGPWGRNPFTESGLDAGIGATLENRTTNRGIRPALIRRPGRHPLAPDHRPRVYVAWTHPAGPWLHSAELESPLEILDLDFDAIAEGVPDLPAYYEPVDHEVLFVCTNGRRDQCCALLGRPLLDAVAASHHERVWETTHLSGHRFAPTTLLLPSGNVHGRVRDVGALLAAADRGELIREGWRGRSTWSDEGQAAEAAARDLVGDLALSALSVDSRDSTTHEVRHLDGRTWMVQVESYTEGSRAPSCGKAPEPITRFTTRVASAS